jgi:hypothetical protein
MKSAAMSRVAFPRSCHRQLLIPVVLILLAVPSTPGSIHCQAADESEPPATATAAAPASTDTWVRLFDGTSLAGWKITPFAGAGEVEVNDGSIFLGMGAMLTGIVHTNPIPTIDYEVTLKAMKIDGTDFFCGLTFPVKDSFCTLIAGGWGGGLVGLSSLDNYDASENETATFRSFEKNRWYSFRLRVTEAKIEAWLDGDPLIDVAIAGRKISLRPGDIELSVPFGIAAWQTRAALRDIRLRRLEPGEIPSPGTTKP